MIPVEYLWLTLIGFWGFVGSARGLAKELGSSAVLMLTLFTSYILWGMVISKVVGALQGKAGFLTPATIEAMYYSFIIIGVTFIAYQGVVLSFPMRETKGLVKVFLGYFGGLFNGYLIIGTLWNAAAQANYFQPNLHLVSGSLSNLHNAIVQWLPISLMDRTSPFIFLVGGMFLLLLIILK
jgi:hypothetical protein